MRRLTLRLSLLLLVLTMLFYVWSSTNEALSEQLGEMSVGLFKYQPQASEIMMASTVFIPVVKRHAKALYPTTSYYFNTINSTNVGEEGCQLGNKVERREGLQDNVAIIDFGQPWKSSGIYGVYLIDV